MARIQAVEPRDAGPFTRLVLRIAEKQAGKLPEPFAVQAHHPLLMNGYGAFEMAFQRSRKAPHKLKTLAELKAAAMVGCEWCLDFASFLARETRISEQQLRDLPTFRESDAFSEDEKLVLEYAEGITKTPVEVSDELFERLRARFDEAQIVELTYAAAIENLRARFNWALGIGSQDYSEGAFCIRAENGSASEAPKPAKAGAA